MPTANNLPGQTSFLSGLSAGIGNFLLAQRMKNEAEVHENRQYIVNDMAKRMEHVRPEDLPLALQYFQKAIDSKTEDDLHKAYGGFTSKLMPEDWMGEQGARAKNAQADTTNAASNQTAIEQAKAYQQALANGGMTLGQAPVGGPIGGPDTIGPGVGGPPAQVQSPEIPQNYIQQQEADAVQAAAIKQLPEGVTAKIFAKPTDPGYAPDKALIPASQAEPDAKPISLAKVDPNAYAKGKIRVMTEEGKQQRQLATFTKQQEIRQANTIAQIHERIKGNLAKVQEQQKMGKIKVVPGTDTYDEDTDTTSVATIDTNTNEKSFITIPGKTANIQKLYQNQEKIDNAKEKADAEIEIKRASEKFKEDIGTKRLEEWTKYTESRIAKNSADVQALGQKQIVETLKIRANELKTKIQATAGEIKSAMSSLSGSSQAQVGKLRAELKGYMDAYDNLVNPENLSKIIGSVQADTNGGTPAPVATPGATTPKAKVQGRTAAELKQGLK